MQGVLISLGRLLFRLVVGVVIALILALIVALAREGDSFASSLRIALVVVGGFTFLLAGAGNSPGRRTALDAEPASWVHYKLGLRRTRSAPYTGAVLGDAVIFVLVGGTLMTIGLMMPR